MWKIINTQNSQNASSPQSVCPLSLSICEPDLQMNLYVNSMHELQGFFVEHFAHARHSISITRSENSLDTKISLHRGKNINTKLSFLTAAMTCNPLLISL